MMAYMTYGLTLYLHIHHLPDDEGAEQVNADSARQQHVTQRRDKERREMIGRHVINSAGDKERQRTQYVCGSAPFRGQRPDFHAQVFALSDNAGEVGEYFRQVAADFLLHGEHDDEEMHVRLID